MRDELKASLILLAAFVLFGCLLYPAAVLLAAHALAPEAARGSLLTTPDGTIVGSRLIAQSFKSDRYFWPRPSAVDYNASAAGSRSHTPTGAALRSEVAAACSNLSTGKNASPAPLPSDLITASASGLDPDISETAALWQLPRVAAARGLGAKTLGELIQRHTTRRPGAATVNVLELNLALDRMATRF